MNGKDYLFIVLLSLGCSKSNNSSDYVSDRSKDTIDLHQENEILVNIKVDSLVEYNHSITDDSQCRSWQIPDESDFPKIFESLLISTAEQWNMCYGDWTCGVDGFFYSGSIQYFFRMDAGGWIILNDQNSDDQLFFVCPKNNECWDYFPSESFCDENGNFIEPE